MSEPEPEPEPEQAARLASRLEPLDACTLLGLLRRPANHALMAACSRRRHDKFRPVGLSGAADSQHNSVYCLPANCHRERFLPIRLINYRPARLPIKRCHQNF